MNFYRRKLPHWQPHGATYFVTFRLAGSLPRKAVKELREKRNELIHKYIPDSPQEDRLFELRKKIHKYFFIKYDHLLDECTSGPTWLAKPEIAEIVKEAIHYRDTKEYELYAYCLMSNHVHLVFKLPEPKSINPKENEDFPVTKIMHSLKWYTALESNKILGRTGNSFWQAESYDHVVRDSDELERIIYYTLHNPVKAGLAKKWQNWPHSYCAPDFLGHYKLE